jgi:hypothetical protein
MKTIRNATIAALALAGATAATISTASAEDQCINYGFGNSQLSYCRNNVEPLFPSLGYGQPVYQQPTIVQPQVVYAQPAPVIIQRGPAWELRKEIRALRRMERNAHLSRWERKRLNAKIARKMDRLARITHPGRGWGHGHRR